MKIKVLCINDKNKPSQIPQEKWVIQGIEYHVQHVFNQMQQPHLLGVELSEIDISTCFPYNCFGINRFAFRPEDMQNMELLMRQCSELNNIDIHAIIGELNSIENKVSTETLISDCKISIRAKNLLENGKIITISDLIQLKKSELMKYRNFGVVSLKEVCDFLEENNLKFKEE